MFSNANKHPQIIILFLCTYFWLPCLLYIKSYFLQLSNYKRMKRRELASWRTRARKKAARRGGGPRGAGAAEVRRWMAAVLSPAGEGARLVAGVLGGWGTGRSKDVWEMSWCVGVTSGEMSWCRGHEWGDELMCKWVIVYYRAVYNRTRDK